MSLLGSMNAAISGLTAQSRALGHISDNVSNSQTVGYKRLDTAFENMVTSSSPRLHLPGSVVATPKATNTLQGSVEQTENPLSLAISGQGFFAAARSVGEGADGTTLFSAERRYTRAGDFQMDENGYMVNSAGDTLQGFTVNADGSVNETLLEPIRIPTTDVQQPQRTEAMTLSGNLPTTPDGSPMETVTQIYDAEGTMHELRLRWDELTPPVPGAWRLTATAPDSTTALGTVEVRFGTAATPATDPGRIGQITNATGTLGFTSGAAGTPATVTMPVNFPGMPVGGQVVTLNLGEIGGTDGMTQYSGSRYELRGLTQNGAPQGAFSSVVTREDGSIVVNYDNGQSRTVAKVPVFTFANPDKLQRLDGQAFGETRDSGLAVRRSPGDGGAGAITASAVERSNVDIASEFSKLIVAQRAYSANTRIVTASDEMLQDTINMKR